MYTYIKPLVRDETMAHEAFLESWRGAELEIAGIDGLKQYRTVVPVTPETAEFDGIAELQFETLDALRAAVGIDRDRTPAESERMGGNILGRTAEIGIRDPPGIIGEEVIEKAEVDGETDGLYKHSAFLDRKAGMTHGEFYEYWANEHAPIAREVPGVVRYVRVIPTDPERAAFDGVAELYFEDLGALRAVLGDESSRDYDPDDPKAKALRADAENLHSIDGRPRFIGKEFVRVDQQQR